MPTFGKGKLNQERISAQQREAAERYKSSRASKWEPVELSLAWEALTRPAFAFWVRLHTFTAQQMKSGRIGWARSLKVSEFTMYPWIKELTDKEYIELVPKANGTKTGLVLKKRARVRFGHRNTWFVQV